MDDLIRPAPGQVLDVSALTRLIKRQLEGPFSQTWVQGEISNLRRQSSGHVYFSLKDSGSQLPCVLFARDAARQSFELDDGMEVLLLGDLSVYEPHGRYQLITKIAIRSGEGRLQLEYERLKRKLAMEGLFDADRKEALPSLPLRIAVITSPTGAAIRDFLRILKRREYGGEVIIFPARVQGNGAAEEVAAMLEHANASPDFDLVVLTRGGGSIEDLWAFNEETLARSVAESRLPVISAIGHEIDHVLTDFAADKRAETPSGAAELISSLYLDARQRLDGVWDDLLARTESAIWERSQLIVGLAARLQLIAPSRQVEHLGMRIDEMENRLTRNVERRLNRFQSKLHGLSEGLSQHHPQMRIKLAHQKLLSLGGQIERAVAQSLQTSHSKIENYSRRLESNSLNAALKRGYSILQSTDGRILSDKESVARESKLKARLRDGEIELRTGNGSFKSE
ncbi:MAG: exodeoxyribonuclease VII large subunit [Verrucomicrobiota bacterium]